MREIAIAWETFPHELTIRKADDVFACPDADARYDPIPKTGTLIYAVFDCVFPDSPKPRPVEIHPPRTLKLSRPADAKALQPWLSKRGFRRTINDYDFTI